MDEVENEHFIPETIRFPRLEILVLPAPSVKE